MKQPGPAAGDRPAARKGRRGELLGYGLIAASVWLGWEVVKAPVAVRAPPALAVRVAPTSPEVLRRAAERELLAERNDNAISLSQESLARAPFNARALRVRGLAAARAGDEFAANQMLTLAGNWSLRDDPAHAWLVEYRLRRGDYNSSFAHADTLARRRPDLHPRIFDLYTTAALHDPRATGTLARLLAAAPPWRAAYWDYLHQRDGSDALLLTLAVALERTDHPFDRDELSELYRKWVGERRFDAARYLRDQLGRPSPELAVQDGGFSDPPERQILPFAWRLGTGAGLAVEVTADDLDPRNQALLVHYNGRGQHAAAIQHVLLRPGRWVLTARRRIDGGDGDAGLALRVTCTATGAGLASLDPAGRSRGSGWETVSAEFTVPADNCPAQFVSLLTRPGDRPTALTAWFDDVAIRPAPAGGGL